MGETSKENQTGLTIKINNDIDDFATAALYLYEHYSDLRKTVNFCRIVCGLIVLLSLFEGFYKQQMMQFILAGLFFVFFLLLPRYSRWNFKRQVLKNITAPGLHEHEIREEGLYTKTTAGEEMRYWNSIQKAEYTEKGIFLWLGPNNIFMIPTGRFIEGSSTAFVEAIKEKMT